MMMCIVHDTINDADICKHNFLSKIVQTHIREGLREEGLQPTYYSHNYELVQYLIIPQIISITIPWSIIIKRIYYETVAGGAEAVSMGMKILVSVLVELLI